MSRDSRHSMAASRPSHVFGSNPANSAAALAKFIEKKKEFDAVSALQRASALYLQRIESLAEDCEIMADAGQIHGEVLEQWPRMFQILMAAREEHGSDSTPTTHPNLGQPLVRIPIEELEDVSDEQRHKTAE
ncbi:hypothetical protein R3P38DRAFT_3168963 [Favolaschia claudopus]|uniref:DASH complex subunit DAD2 n=1 Tax=Favolaschia claudopus TaxID=2862362 RepID=A0AAW0E0S5_9AGAR